MCWLEGFIYDAFVLLLSVLSVLSVVLTGVVYICLVAGGLAGRLAEERSQTGPDDEVGR